MPNNNNNNAAVKLRFDGRYEFVKDEDNRQWTIMSTHIGPDGCDYYKSSRMLQGLKELGIVPIRRLSEPEQRDAFNIAVKNGYGLILAIRNPGRGK